MNQAGLLLVLIGVFLLSLILFFFLRRAKSRALELFEYDRSISTDGIFVGETLTLTETAKNPTWFPLVKQRVEFYVSAGVTVDGVECREYTKLTSIFNIPPYSTVTKTHTVRADKRGHFIVSPAVLRQGQIEYDFNITQEFYGYPDFFGASTDMPADVLSAGSYVSSRKYIEDPFFLSTIREYRAGDPMRSINFKASVRSFSNGARTLMCNSYDSSRSYDTMIFLDLNRYAESNVNSELRLETGLKYACYLFCEALENGGRVGFAVNSVSHGQNFAFIPCGSGDAHVKRILEQFALLNSYSVREYSIAALMRNAIGELKSGTDIFVITPYVDENTAEMISLLTRAGRNVSVIPITGGA